MAIRDVFYTCARAIPAFAVPVIGRQLGDGRIIGRVLCGGIYLCDACACEWLAVAVFESGDAPPAMAAN